MVAGYIDSFTGVKGTLGYIVVLSAVTACHYWFRSAPTAQKAEPEEPEEPAPPRNFTPKQLAYFDGKKDDNGHDKPIYLSLNRTVFDVSKGRDFYGPDGPYELFAGHECGVAMAKFSFDTTHLDDFEGCTSLKAGEKSELDGWIEKFTHYRCYPVKGKLVVEEELPSSDRIMAKEDLAKCDGTQDIPEGYAAAPIYIGAGDKVFDASFGGVEFYGPGCSYHLFAGKDASRALAKMSFDAADTETADISDLEEKQLKVLEDWIKTFGERKNYPVVGRLGKEEEEKKKE